MAPLNQINKRQPFYNRDNLGQQRPMSNEGNRNLFDVKYKVLLLGDTLVGKTSLQRFIAGKDFRTDIGATIGVDFVNKIIPIEQSKINLQIWDTAGQRNFRTIGRGYYASSKAFVLVYDVTNMESFRLIEHFSHSIEQAGLDLERRYLIANKIDLIEDRKVDEELGQRFALRNSMIYFETSCRTGENIQEFFEQIASDLVRQYHPKLLESHLPILNNFAFNYYVPPTIDHKLSEKLRNADNQQKDNTKTKIKFKRPEFSSLNSINKNESSHFYRFIICCKPRKAADIDN
ncbi:unnamed protein product [Rotaria socialis]|uniref:Uncharacterized protein n=1 Tax=Rotaria socialis TaxID=392032 RepID=A0A817T1V7_9BILA|nr:unnamed protein product [Rotaria socialis]CAF3306872.1 unnamed protein product [Rotaria socialis]CAF3625227.1 unnamed protein product [Rotaria socialis]CAF3650313.1 unnamed protein product [Rotaria socialis]CAF3696783.1 unnamed protein product [Rotaria socialis]